MKTSHHFLAVLLAVLLCLSLTACGDSSDDVTGDDWRASGVVAAEGTITHEGEGSVKVLVTVGPESATFYRDEPEQELFDSVSFPVTVEDANDDGTGFDISFDDITGDGESDVVVTFQHADMSTTQMVWFWDARSSLIEFVRPGERIMRTAMVSPSARPRQPKEAETQPHMPDASTANIIITP